MLRMDYKPTLVPGMKYEQFAEQLLIIKKGCKGNVDCLAINQGSVVEELEAAGMGRQWVRTAKKVLDLVKKAPKKSLQLVDSKGLTYTPPQEPNIGGVGVSPSTDELARVKDKLNNLRAQFGSYLLVSDTQALDIVLAIVAGHYWYGRSPAWLLVIGPPGSGKTEYIDIFNKMQPLVQQLSDVTEKTWISGLDEKDAKNEETPSLLCKFPYNIFTYKDLTTMLSKRVEGRVATFGQFTEIFDGHMNKRFGTGNEVKWEGFATLLMGVTQIIYHQHSILSLLGPRFLLMRLKLSSGEEQSMFSLKVNPRQYKDSKDQMQLMVKEFFEDLPKWQPELPERYHRLMANMGQMIALARSSPERDREGDIEMTYEAEMPSRVTQQLTRLAQGLALIHGKYEVDDEEIGYVRRLALDTLLPVRAHILSKLYTNKELGVGDLRNNGTYGDAYVQSSLSDMRAFQVVIPKGDIAGGELWTLTSSFKDTLDKVGGI